MISRFSYGHVIETEAILQKPAADNGALSESADLLRKSLLLSLGAAQISSADSCEQDKRLKFELLIVYMYSKKLLTENTGWYYNSRN